MKLKNLLISGLAVTASHLIAETEAQKPNVLFFLADDHQDALVAALGNRQIKTPHLDTLVNRGTTFTNAHAEFPCCAPSRASILSGCSGFTHKAIYPRWSSYFNPKLLPTTWPKVMKNNGYQTFWTGKWNSAGKPKKYGIEETDCLFVGGMGSHQVKLKSNGKVYKGFSSTVFTDAAIRFLDQYDGQKPFFATVAFTAPHDPRTPPKEFEDMYKDAEIPLPGNFVPNHPFDDGFLTIRDEKLLPRPRTEKAVKREIALYYGMISQMDQQIGRTINKLKEKGLLENTIIVFAGDHGLAVGHHGLLGKFSMYDHSTKTPLIFAGPGTAKGQKKQALSYLHDIFPTVCDLANIKTPEVVEGKSLKKVITGKEDSVRKYIFCAHADKQRMVRTERYKLIRFFRNEKEKKGTNRWMLFDLKNDPSEMQDQYNNPEYTKVIKELKQELQQWRENLNDPLLAIKK